MGDVIDLASHRRAAAGRDELVDALEDLALVVELVLSRVRAGERWSATHYVIRNLPSLAAIARTLADDLGEQSGRAPRRGR